MLVAITGTPGVGKTTVCNLLSDDYEVISVNDFAKENGCFEDFDEEAGSYNVDTDRLGMLLQEHRSGKTVLLDGHLSHYVECDMIIVLRCKPSLLSQRLSERGYIPEKVRENVQAEVLDVILSESAEANHNTFEIDCTSMSADMIAEAVKDIINGRDTSRFIPGKVSWTGEMEEWF